MQNANTLEAMEVARQLILVLKGTVESLQMNLSQERDDNEGLKLTIESLEERMRAFRRNSSKSRRVPSKRRIQQRRTKPKPSKPSVRSSPSTIRL